MEAIPNALYLKQLALPTKEKNACMVATRVLLQYDLAAYYRFYHRPLIVGKSDVLYLRLQNRPFHVLFSSNATGHLFLE
jgi:hypothetical protein